MSTRCSLLVTGGLTAALSVVGLAGDVYAQSELTVSVSPASIGEPASATSTPTPKSTITVSLKNGAVDADGDPKDFSTSTMITLTFGGTAEFSDYDWDLASGSNDATLNGNVLTFAIIEADKTGTARLTLESTHDTDPEGDETVSITVMGVVEDVSLNNATVLTITDNDNPGVSTLELGVSGTMLKESDAKDSVKSVVKVTVENKSGLTFTTDQRIQLELGGDATEGDDYTIDKKVLTLAAGMTKVEAKITVVDDMVYDGRVAETINVTAYVDSVRLPGGSNGTHTIQIEDNDQNPEDFEVSVDPMMIMEGEVATLTVTAMDNVASARTFMLTLAGTAMENSDYTIPSELMIPKDTKTGSVQLRAVTDAVAEMDETVMITVMAGGVMIGTVQTVTITGDPDAPTIPTPTPALPIFGAFALGAGLFAAGRARLRGRGQLTRQAE